jgi:hypothetical protein
MRIYVGGSLRNVPRDEELCHRFAEALGVEIVKQGHYLLNGCRSAFDEKIARAAYEWLQANDIANANERIVSFCMRGEKQVHDFGKVSDSELVDWEMNHPVLKAPEQIAKAAATIFVAGSEGTYWARNWAHYARRPILGIPRFGGAGEEIYRQEFELLQRRSLSVSNDFEALRRKNLDVVSYAQQVVDLAEHLVMPKSVFVIMSFDKKYLPVYRSFDVVCGEFGLKADRTDRSMSTDRIVPRIENGIRDSPFVIADLSDESVNVLYEVGFARALNKPVILTAKNGTRLPFDAHDIPTIFWNAQADLRKKLRHQIRAVIEKLDSA